MKNENEKDESKYKVEFLGEKFSKDLLTYKVNVLGLYGVGKTTIIHKLMKKEICNDYSPTISVDIANFQVKVNDKIIQIQIWDCCGNDQFALNTKNLFVNTSVAILVYAINNKKSFKNLEEWHNILKTYTFECTLFLIGNKNDLENEREIIIEDVETFKNNYDDIKMFFETSAKTGNNIDKLLENIAISIYEKIENDEKKLEKAMNDNTIHKLDKENHKKKRKKIWIF
jgi:small GTP-binding protein